MTEGLDFSTKEREETWSLYQYIRQQIAAYLQEGDEDNIRQHLMNAIGSHQVSRNVFGQNPVLLSFQTARLLIEEIGLRRDGVLAVLLRPIVEQGQLSIIEVKDSYGDSVARILHGLQRIQDLYQKNPVIESENFRNLLLSFAEDMRVILIMIADRVNLMRQIKDTTETDAQRKVSEEAAYLYAPLAHKLGLYKLKSELEDLSLKYLEHDAYYHIKDKLSETKQSRDAYIERFIQPISERLKEAGLSFHIKGRTKSIHSIWQKMKKQQCPFEGVYDLFAIRIIIEVDDRELETRERHRQELLHCWQTFALITSMYQPNPKRLRDWLSVPKSNGYESLHITVLGPEQKWVEVQIRTERMDQIAECGVAAHWRYKGVKSDTGLDDWLTGIRTMLESSAAAPAETTLEGANLMDQFKVELYEDEVFVFTPKGDLYKFPKGATVLDFAYHIHSKIGNQCVGARINNKVVNIRQQLQSGDQVEIMTSGNQKPKQDWLTIVKTSRAKSKIRLALKETQVKDALFAKEMLERKFKNRKLEMDESIMQQLIKKLGFKEVSDFYRHVASGELDVNTVLDRYVELQQGVLPVTGNNIAQSAADFVLDDSRLSTHSPQISDDVLVIDRNLKGVDYQLARCCQPIYGDAVFGFVTVSGGIKIHREDCPNAPELKKRFGYRVVKARWSGKGASQYTITLRVIGNDDIGIVNNLTSIISKEEKLILRSINIDSHDGLFSGNLVIMIDDNTRLQALIKKLRTVKGVKQVMRI